MKTLNNLFGKNASVKNITDFNQFSLNVTQMNSIKGGTEPLGTGLGGQVPNEPPKEI